ncbi:MAG: MbtH family NRPS accessory protein [Actinomycetota bacterium]|nr:MbtH family NRPS accessory protein [Actinomycetota bacterium]
MPFGRLGELLRIDRFDGRTGSFLVLGSKVEHHSLWGGVPTGCRPASGTAKRTSCLASIEQNRSTTRPLNHPSGPAF